MHRYLAAALAALPLFTLEARAQREFEGVITLRLAGPGAGAGANAPAQQFEYLVRGRKLRMNVPGPMGGMAVIAMPAEQKVYMLVASQNAYMEVPLAPVKATGDKVAAKASGATMTRTGKKETIAGVPCEYITIASEGQKADICVAKGLGSFINPMSAMRGGVEPAWQRELGRDGFPLKVVQGDGTVAMEVTKVERKRLDNALFTIPDNYARIAMPARK